MYPKTVHYHVLRCSLPASPTKSPWILDRRRNTNASIASMGRAVRLLLVAVACILLLSTLFALPAPGNPRLEGLASIKSWNHIKPTAERLGQLRMALARMSPFGSGRGNGETDQEQLLARPEKEGVQMLVNLEEHVGEESKNVIDSLWKESEAFLIACEKKLGAYYAVLRDDTIDEILMQMETMNRLLGLGEGQDAVQLEAVLNDLKEVRTKPTELLELYGNKELTGCLHVENGISLPGL
ncbi:hypothetical protein K402DRAFT_75666 [Aulographum hederae CBS 113979]|uniref:Uncharacterized protein n=1 Tax=Aulographum hederae CBS 113979 TaxID=1176131 RepID=A0A6G1HFP0_9PEZI|nr:hypothetical protein K402DRAFT_75666 [Aulographum hederae CBS 113979]